MTVKELTEKLQTFSADAEVMFDSEYDCERIYFIIEKVELDETYQPNVVMLRSV